MDKHDQACELAGFLAPMLRGACDTAGDPAAAQRPSPDEIVDHTEPDVDLAIRLELQDLLREEPALLRPPPGRSEPDCEQVRERLRRLFSQNGGHTVNVLWALVAGADDKPHPNVPWLIPAPKTDNRWRKFAGWTSCLRKHAWLQRKVAGLWMNLLIASVLAIAWWVAWPPPAGPSDLLRAFRTADLWLIHAADCCSRYSSWTCCGVRY